MADVSSFLPLYIGLLIAGFLLIGVEVYVPGGIIGSIGIVALVAAMILGFRFPAPYGLWSATLIVVGCGAGLIWWVRVFPRTRAGRTLSLERDTRGFSAANPQWAGLAGREGRTITALRPSGIAQIDGHRVDVTAANQWIEADVPIRVVSVQGMRVIVEPAAAESRA
jgi:membrane-bound serine protease (ClpP class)